MDAFITANAAYIISGFFGLLVGALAAFAPSLLNRGLTQASQKKIDAEAAQIFSHMADEAIERVTKIHDMEMAEQKRQLAEIRVELAGMTGKYEAIRRMSNAQEVKLSELESRYRKLEKEHEKLSAKFARLQKERDVYKAQLIDNQIIPLVPAEE